MSVELPRRLEAHWRARGWPTGDARVAVAVSGGLDSMVLWHLLRFSTPGLGLAVEVAHFDHRMRAGSADDAAWVRGVAGAWRSPLHEGAAERPVRDAAAARDLRYRFLEGLGREGVAKVATAHHADDQVETVLYRIARGTGVEGLAGIPASRGPAVLRPLLPFSRAALESYADRFEIRWREDPSNRSLRFARNRIRHRVLPELERARPGSREAILRLSRNARRTGAALRALLEPVVESVLIEADGTSVAMDRDALLVLSEPVLAEVVREVASSLGFRLSEAGTGDAVQFITTVRSGGVSTLTGGLRIRRDFGRIVLDRGTDPDDRLPGARVSRELAIRAPDSGEATVAIGGDVRRVRWGTGLRGPGERTGEGWRWVAFEPDSLEFPLVVRGWRPGDRIRTPGGTKKLKKVFVELREPRPRRHRLPLLVDARGRVLWIPGRHLASGWPRGSTGDWYVGVDDVDER